MAILTFEVKGQTLTVKSSIEKIVENSINYLNCVIKSDDPEWNQENLGKYLVITTKDGKSYEQGYGLISGDNIIKAPGFQVSVIGKKKESDKDNGIQITTQPVFVQVYPSGATEGDKTTETKLPALSEGEKQLIAFNQAVETIKKISDNKVNNFLSPNDENYPTTKAVSDFVEEKNSSIIEETKSNTSELKALKKNQTYESTSFNSLPLYDHKIKYGGTEWTDSTYKHSLIKISSDLWGKTIILHTRENSYSEIAFFEDFNIEEYDYTSAPPYVAGTGFIQMGTGGNKEFDYQIPEKTSWIYFSRQTNTGVDLTPAKLEIDGYNYCEGVTHNIQSVQKSLNTHIENYINFSLLGKKYSGKINSINSEWNINESYKHLIIPIPQNFEGKNMEVFGNSSEKAKDGEIAFLETFPTYEEDTPPFVKDTGLQTFGAGARRVYTIPEKTKYIYILCDYNNEENASLPTKILINGIDYLEGILSNIKKVDQRLENQGIMQLINLPLIEGKLTHSESITELEKDRTWDYLNFAKSVLLPYSKKEEDETLYISSNVAGEIAFFSKYHDSSYSSLDVAPCLSFLAGYDDKSRNLYEFGEKTVDVPIKIPDGTQYIYVLYETNDRGTRLPSKLEINGYDYCKGVTDNILEQKKLLDKNIQSVQESLDTHINNIVENFEGNTDNNDKYPSVKAVYDFVNQSEHITKITETDTYIWDLPPGVYTFTTTSVTQKIYFGLNANYPCDEGAFLIVGGENYSGNLPSATTFKKSVIFLKNIRAMTAQIIAGISTVTCTVEDGTKTYTAEWDGGIIESQDNKVNTIDGNVTIGQYPSAKATYNYVEEKANKISSNSANALKNIVKNKNLVEISDISSLEHELKISTGPGMRITAYCRGKNLFGLEGRTQVTDIGIETGTHTFTGKGIFTGVTANNYYRPSRVTFEYDNETEEIKFSSTNEWYGLGIDIEVQPRASYSISVEDLTEKFAISVSFYTDSGVFIMNSSLTSLINKETKTRTFMAPDNAKWAIIVLVPQTGAEKTMGAFKKVQVEKNTIATAFEKYVVPQIGVSNVNTGVISGLKSIYPTTIIDVNLKDVLITCEYNRDINKAYNELQSNYEKLKTAIEKLGGTIE